MLPYNDYATYLKNKYGCRVHRIGIDGGFTCPNRDGADGQDGCLYCNSQGSRSGYADPLDSVDIQLKKRIAFLRSKYGICKAIAYFQAFTSTYDTLDKLKARYDSILRYPEIIGLVIGTRPDAIDEDKLRLIASYTTNYDVWIEYGLQSIHDRTLQLLNRRHTLNDFLDAVKKTKKHPISICCHVILGLPGESHKDMLETAKRLSSLPIDGIKIHLLHVLKGSKLEEMFYRNEVRLLQQDEYAELVCDFLEHLSQNIVVMRLTGQGDRENHIAPMWAFDKLGTIQRIKDIFARRGTCQGSRL